MVSENDNNNNMAAWNLDKLFDPDTIKDGVEGDGIIHALKQYAGWLIYKETPKKAFFTTLVEWNKNNRPPIPDDVLQIILGWCWRTWVVKKKLIRRDE